MMKSLTTIALKIILAIEGFMALMIIASFIAPAPAYVFFEFGNIEKTNTAIATG